MKQALIITSHPSYSADLQHILGREEIPIKLRAIHPMDPKTLLIVLPDKLELNKNELIIVETSVFHFSSVPRAFQSSTAEATLRMIRERAPEVPIVALLAHPPEEEKDEFITMLPFDGQIRLHFLFSARFGQKHWNQLVETAKRNRQSSAREDLGKRDVFICHASEDKGNVVEPLIEAISKTSISFWYDRKEITWGDRIVEKVNAGLRDARFVLVVLSKTSIQKGWPKAELASALQTELSDGKKRVLPLLVGDNETKQAILNELPLLKDKRYLTWTGSGKAIADEILTILKREG